ncbi:MAG: sugar ABC transporter substrate-binding protein [Gemmatimonadota bacterium]|nr:sugar ABC transporter substrate-binding protein [Gemmatimonadota bacterium]
MTFRGAFLALVTAAACSDSRGSDTVTLRFWGMGREGEVVQELIPAFERENPGVHVEVQQIPWTAAHEKLLTAYVGDATPDVAQLGNTWVPEFVALDALAPLDTLVAGSDVVRPDDYFSGIWDTNVIDRALYGVPWYVDTRVIFYRTDILARAGYDAPPRTWAEWLEAMRALRGQMGAERWPILLPTNEWPQPVVLALQAGSPLLRDGGQFGAFREPAFRQAFEFYVEIFRQGLAPTVANTQISNVYDEFGRGTFAMYITGPWNIGEFRRRLPDSVQGLWTTAPMPGPRAGEAGASLAGGASLVVFRDSDHQTAAWKLVEYLSAPEQQRRFYELTGNLPPRRSVWRDPSLSGDRHARAFYEQLQHVVPLPKVPEAEQIAIRITEAVEQAVRGRATTDEALAALDRDVDRMLEKRRWMLARKE